MYGFVGSYSRLRFCVITSSFVRYVPINNKRLLVGAGLGLHNWEVSGALWASSFTEEPTVVANSTGAVCSGAQTAGQWARFQIAKMAYGQVMDGCFLGTKHVFLYPHNTCPLPSPPLPKYAL